MTMTVPSGNESVKSEVKKEVEQTFTDSVIKTTEESKTLNLKWLVSYSLHPYRTFFKIMIADSEEAER